MEKRGKGKNKITLYTLPGCIFCRELKYNLDHLKIEYSEIDASSGYYSTHIDELENRLKTTQYPIIFVDRTIQNLKFEYEVRRDIILLSSNLESRENIHIISHINPIIKTIQNFEI